MEHQKTVVEFYFPGIKADGYIKSMTLSSVPRVGDRVTLWTDCKDNMPISTRAWEDHGKYLVEDSIVFRVDWIFEERYKSLPGDRGYPEDLQFASVYLKRL